MADVAAIFGILLSLGITFPGLLAAFWLLFPASVERARLRLDDTPWQCFWLGGVILALAVVPTVVLLALPFGPAKFVGWALIVLVLTFSSIGAAGIAAKMAERLAAGRSAGGSPAAAFVRSALAMELAMVFPGLGWFIVLPLVVVVSLGATGFALLHWLPKKVPALESVSA